MKSLPPFRAAGFFAGRTALHGDAIARLPGNAAAGFFAEIWRFCPGAPKPAATMRSVAAVAQLDRVLGYEPRGRGFDSCQPHQKTQSPEVERLRSEERRVGKECRSRWSP